jgi:hypothetical protein
MSNPKQTKQVVLSVDTISIDQANQAVQTLSHNFTQIKEVWKLNPHIPSPHNWSEFASYADTPEKWIRAKIADRIRSEKTASVANFMLNPEKLAQLTEIPDFDLILRYLPSIVSHQKYWNCIDYTTGNPIPEKVEQMENGYKITTTNPEAIELKQALDRFASDLSTIVGYTGVKLQNVSQWLDVDVHGRFYVKPSIWSSYYFTQIVHKK